MNILEKSLLKSIENGQTVFLIGNGINRYPNNPIERSWENILVAINNELTKPPINFIPKGITLTEFHDVLDLKTDEKSSVIQQAFIDRLKWEPDEHHRRIVGAIKKLNLPILTTNFDLVLESCENCSLQRHKINGYRALTDYYPWDTYYSDTPKDNPFDSFSIWHMHGQTDYKRSIKLGLNHYMLMVNRAKTHFPNTSSIEFNPEFSRTWLKLMFEKDLCIFGLGLDEQEVFIRWLFLERAKYFKKYPDKAKEGWYINFDDSNEYNLGKKFFMKSVGIKYIDYLEGNKYDKFYVDFWRQFE